MDDVAELPDDDRGDLFTTVASERGNMSPLIVEKGFRAYSRFKHLLEPCGISRATRRSPRHTV